MGPLARTSEIYAENLPEEVILYDKSNNKVHSLSKIAAGVWQNCDGTKSVDDLEHIVAAKSGASIDRNAVLLALDQLEKAGLIEAGGRTVSAAGLTSRREAVGTIAMAGTAMVATIVAPAPVAHASHSKATLPGRH
jgi:hypothetical protein